MFIARWGGLLRNHCRSPPQRAITDLCIVILYRLVTKLEFMGQQWCQVYLLDFDQHALTVIIMLDLTPYHPLNYVFSV